MIGDSGSEHDEPSIGVGMGGSCPECRAPVDLAQEFCLECGAAIRFRAKPKDRKQKQASPVTQTIIMPPKRGFPWIPVIIITALVVGGVLFAVFAGGSDNSGSSRDRKSRTEDALPSIKSTKPEETSETITETLENCDPAFATSDQVPAINDGSGGIDPATGLPLDGSSNGGDPSAIDPTATDPATGALIPTITDDGTAPGGAQGTFGDDAGLGADDQVTGDIPDIGSDDSVGGDDTETVTVDQNGNLCPSGGAGSSETDTSTDPFATDTGGTDTGTDPGTPNDGSGWPDGKEGFTIILLGFSKDQGYTEADANNRSADAQAAGLTEAGVLDSDAFTSLCPGFYVVYSGVYDKEKDANDDLADVKSKGFAGAYVRPINNTEQASCEPT